MHIIVCLDDNNGMAFNNRRQSMDRVVREKILSLCKGDRLYMSGYSFAQFTEVAENIIVDENFLSAAGKDDFCFVETCTFSPDTAERLYVFKWNRVYPSDLKLSFDIEKSGFALLESTDFEGFSHEKITLEIYERESI
ncbi:MAG: ribonuclease Z [Clostridia bacterium]|nr:ribonuclease Z [Clostridia bacterium]